MILYHGTNVDFEKIDVSKSKPYKDFGQGFYLTDIRSQAENMAKRKFLAFGNEKVVQEYEFEESHLSDGSLNVKRFDEPNKEWAEFIYKNRQKTIPPYQHNYDIVIGPVADDGVAYLLSRYEEGSYTIEELARELKYKKLNIQYFFGTEKAINLLKRIR